MAAFKRLGKKKATAAMEFIMSHGWALLVVILVIAALAYMGFLSPSKYFPNAINFGSGIYVPDYTMSFFQRGDMKIGYFVVIIKNALNMNMENVQLNISECENNQGKLSKPLLIPSGDSKAIRITCSNLDTTLNQNNYFNVVLTYTTGNNANEMSHSKSAVMQINSQRMTDFPDNNLGRKAWALDNGASAKDDANRFYPCDGASGCINIDDETATLKNVYGGVVDSKTGIIWMQLDAPGKVYNWAIKNMSTPPGVEPAWDRIAPIWNPSTENYDYTGNVNLVFRDDALGTAFTYCTSLVENGFSDWKLPSKSDFDEGMFNCGQCFPPGNYTPRYFWTDTISQLDNEHAACISFPYTVNADCSKDLEVYVRCVRDTPA